MEPRRLLHRGAQILILILLHTRSPGLRVTQLLSCRSSSWVHECTSCQRLQFFFTVQHNLPQTSWDEIVTKRVARQGAAAFAATGLPARLSNLSKPLYIPHAISSFTSFFCPCPEKSELSDGFSAAHRAAEPSEPLTSMPPWPVPSADSGRWCTRIWPRRWPLWVAA